APGVMSAEVAALTKEVLRSMLLTKIKVITAVLLVAGSVCAVAGVSTHVLRTEPEEQKQPNYLATSAKETEKPKSDLGHNDNGKQQEKRRTAEPRVQTLLKERLATLREIAHELEQSNKQSGKTAPEDVVQAKLQVLKAELELCETEREQVTVHERI